MSEPGKDWAPDENFLRELMEMGFLKQAAEEALLCTNNDSLDAAVNYIMDNGDGSPTNMYSMAKKLDSNVTEESESDEDQDYYKMVFVVNTELKMGVGKIAAQVGHACLGLYRDMIKNNLKEQLDIWEEIGEKKIVLKGTNHLHLLDLYEKSREAKIPCYLIRDAGHTQIAPNSVTVFSIFGTEDVVDSITGKLNLL